MDALKFKIVAYPFKDSDATTTLEMEAFNQQAAVAEFEKVYPAWRIKSIDEA